MSKKMEDLEISAVVHAPCGRGSVEINTSECIFCGQNDPTKITVLSEKKQKIKHSLGHEEGDDATVYELECDVCHKKYKIGIIKIQGNVGDNTTELNSVFSNDEKTNNKWVWLGYY
ncbi:MAG: hypothetical protein ACTSVI_11570 [Promethearchaeota archaeon]